MAKRTKEQTKEVLSAKLDRWWDEDSGARKKIDWSWFLYDIWKEGHHYARYDKSTQQVIGAPKSDGRPKVMANKIDPVIRAVVNYALRNRPKAEVTPAGITRDGMKDVVRQNLFLDYLHDRLGLREIERGVVEESLSSGVAWIQVLWDEEGDDGQGQIGINEIDKYDLYWQAKARDPKEARRYTLAVVRTIEDLKSDPKYKGTNWDTVKPENQRSSSTFKERLLRLETGSDAQSTGNDQGSVILRECWYYGDKELGEDPDTIYVCAKAGGQIVRDPEATDLTRMPFFRLCVARRKLSMVGKSWIKNLIPLNKRLNSLMSSLAEYNVVMNKVVMVADKGAGVRQFLNQYGLVYEKKRGYQIQQMSPGAPSAMIIEEIKYILQLFEDISAVHDATMGRIPVGAKSGKALEALQVGDSNNLSEVVENTEIWLEELYEYLLTLAATKYQFARDITPVSSTGQREFLRVVGEDAASAPEATGQPAAEPPVDGSMQGPDTMVVKKKNIVDVKITSYLAHTAEARREAIKELATILPDLDPQTILEVYEVGPIADVLDRMKTRREEQQAEELAMMEQQQAMQQGPQAGKPEAIAFIRSIINGQPPTQPPSVGPDFIAYFDEFLSSPEGQDLDPEMIDLLQKVRDDLAAQGQQPGMSSGPAPRANGMRGGGSFPRSPRSAGKPAGPPSA